MADADPVRAGRWAQIRNQKPGERARAYVERIEDGTALLRFGVTTDEGHRWPFPFEIWAPVAVLLPAPRPKFKLLDVPLQAAEPPLALTLDPGELANQLEQDPLQLGRTR